MHTFDRPPPPKAWCVSCDNFKDVTGVHVERVHPGVMGMAELNLSCGHSTDPTHLRKGDELPEEWQRIVPGQHRDIEQPASLGRGAGRALGPVGRARLAKPATMACSPRWRARLGDSLWRLKRAWRTIAPTMVAIALFAMVDKLIEGPRFDAITYAGLIVVIILIELAMDAYDKRSSR